MRFAVISHASISKYTAKDLSVLVAYEFNRIKNLWGILYTATGGQYRISNNIFAQGWKTKTVSIITSAQICGAPQTHSEPTHDGRG